VFVVCVSATGRAVEREVVKRAVEEGRRLVGGRPKVEDSSEFWDSLGICTYESYGGGSEWSEADCLVASSPRRRWLLAENFD
jgi:hypothetical protein